MNPDQQDAALGEGVAVQGCLHLICCALQRPQAGAVKGGSAEEPGLRDGPVGSRETAQKSS